MTPPSSRRTVLHRREPSAIVGDRIESRSLHRRGLPRHHRGAVGLVGAGLALPFDIVTIADVV